MTADGETHVTAEIHGAVETRDPIGADGPAATHDPTPTHDPMVTRDPMATRDPTENRGTAAGHGTVVTRPLESDSSAASCAAGDLGMTVGPKVSEATGQHTVVLRLRDTSPAPCILRGIPTIEVLGRRGRELPFVYRHGNDAMMVSTTPTAVTMRPGGSAVVIVDKYRCDMGAMSMGTSIRLDLPGWARTVSAPLAATDRSLGWCGTDDPGSTITVSPVVARARDVLK